MRIGAREATRTDARIVSATNRELADLVRKGKFREDLFFRLNVVPIVVPPLRARRGDIPELVRYFIRKINREMKVQISGLAPDAESLLVEHSWPGNVRELENALIRACVRGPERGRCGRPGKPVAWASGEKTAPVGVSSSSLLNTSTEKVVGAGHAPSVASAVKPTSTRSWLS